jgi:UDP-N-acetylmuramoyl-tripeptide--D-alanyl-D-alanine ligase
MKIKDLHQLFLKSSGICTDTRKISKGCLFFALKGDNFNGNKFAQEALDKGALKVVIDQIGYHKNTGETILCEDALRRLQKLANYHRKYCNIPIIALTGSNGKTTTKELIAAVLSQKFNTLATAGNFNNHIGVPLTLLSMDSNTEMAVVEMGANHLGEIDQLCTIAEPDYGYITNFGKAHLEGFGSLEGVIQGKTELYKHLYQHKKSVFVNGNDSKQLALSNSMDRFTFGDEEQDCNVRLLDATHKLIVQYKDCTIHSQLIGIYNFHNIAAAIAIGDYFKVDPEHIKIAIESYIPENNRSQIIEKGSNRIILDAYNANPTSMMAALESFKQLEGDNKILFLGDMFELGTHAEIEHQKITDYLVENKLGTCNLIGSNFYKTNSTDKDIHQFSDFDSLKEQLQKLSFENCTMLIKASRGMALERILEFI